jgi:hypothetical protein
VRHVADQTDHPKPREQMLDAQGGEVLLCRVVSVCFPCRIKDFSECRRVTFTHDIEHTFQPLIAEASLKAVAMARRRKPG